MLVPKEITQGSKEPKLRPKPGDRECSAFSGPSTSVLRHRRKNRAQSYALPRRKQPSGGLKWRHPRSSVGGVQIGYISTPRNFGRSRAIPVIRTKYFNISILRASWGGLLHALSWSMSLQTTQRSAVRGVSVKNGETKSMTTNRRGSPERGFSMIELCVVIAI